MEGSPIIDIVNERITEYNFIVDHKHILEKHSHLAHKLMKTARKTHS